MLQSCVAPACLLGKTRSPICAWSRGCPALGARARRRNAAVSRAGIIRPLSPSKGFPLIHRHRQVKPWLSCPLQGKALTLMDEFVCSKHSRLRLCVSPGCFPALCPFGVCVSAASGRLGGSCSVPASPGPLTPRVSEGSSLWPWFWQQGLRALASPVRWLSQLR